MLQFINDRRNQLVIVILFTLFAYINIFANQFVIDDKAFVVNWQEGKSLGNIGKLVGGSLPAGQEGVWRPVRSIIYAVYVPLLGQSPFGYHLHSILVHVGSTVLVYLIAEQLVGSRKEKSTSHQLQAKRSERTVNYLPFLTALLFGLHPVHTEAITYISSSMDATGWFLMLGAFYLYILGTRYYWYSVVVGTIAYFTNEITLVLPLLILIFDFLYANGMQKIKRIDANLAKYAPFFIPAAIYLFIRFLVIDVGARGGYLAGSFYLTALTMVKVLVKYISLVFLPINLANNHIVSPGIEAFVYRDYRQEAILAQSILDVDILFGIVFLSVLVVLAIKVYKTFPVITFGIFWFFICLLPVSQIVPQGSVLNERMLYLPSFGAILILAYFLGKIIASKYQTIGIGLLVIILGFYFVLTFSANRDWHDNITLWSRDIKLAPDDNAYAYFQLGNAYAELGAVDAALENYNKSFEINPRFVVALGSIAKVYEGIGRNDAALETYNKALSVNQGFWEAYLAAGNIFERRADFDLAALAYDALLAVVPDFEEVKQKRAALPSVREATQSAKISDQGVWLRYHKVLGEISLTMPSEWKLKPSVSKVLIDDAKGFEAQIKTTIWDKTQNTEATQEGQLRNREEEYIDSKKEDYGELVNQGQAQIPNFDFAYVRVWENPVKTETEKVITLQFFLFSGKKVVEVLVANSSLPAMGIFDYVLGSFRIDTN